MVKQVHQRTCGQQQEWQERQVRNEVRAMLGDQKKQRYRDEANKYIARDRSPPLACVRGLMIVLHTITPQL
jgi:hypothetical protein